MDALNSLLRTELLASVLMLASFGLILRALIQYGPAKGELQPKLEKTEAELEKYRKHTQPKAKKIQALSTKVQRLQVLEEDLQAYWSELNGMVSSHAATEKDAKGIRVHDIGNE